MMIKNLPKAELHVHLDGSMTTEMVKTIGQRNGIQVSPDIFSPDGKQFVWKDFSDFHKVFEETFKVVKCAQDYRDITYAYLKSLASQNTLYTELIVSPYHAGIGGMTYDQMLQGLVSGIDEARRDFGIEARILMVFLRHYGPKQAEPIARQIIGELHPYIVGVNLVGDIRQHEVAEFEALFSLMRQKGLGVSCHAGELSGGPIEIWQAINNLGATRISHGINCLHDKALMEELAKRKIVLEVCPSSNVILNMFPSYEAHPLKRIVDAGILITLNTDDPGIFDTTLTREYEIAHQYYGLSEQDLLQTTRVAIEAGFIDLALKNKLLDRLSAQKWE